MNTVKASWINSNIFLLLIAALLCLLSACADNNPTPHAFERYLSRLGNVIEQAPPIPSDFSFKNDYPAKRDLIHNYPSSSMNLLDWHSLNDCKLYQYISNHNGSLGKFATSSQRLIYEVNFIKHAPSCIDKLSLQNKKDITDQLAATLAIKKQTLPKRLWEAIVGSHEARTFWQPPYELCNYPADTSSAIIKTINKLNQLSQSILLYKNNPEKLIIESKELENLLKNLSLGDGGYLLRAMALQNHYLLQANAMIEQASNENTFCLKGNKTQKQQYLMNVVQKFFIGDIQTWSADINQRYYQLHSAINQLEETLKNGETVAYKQWRIKRNQQLEKHKLQPAKHITAIKNLRARCYND